MEPHHNSSKPIISVIVCTHNRQDYLVDCLESLRVQDLFPELFEVLVVDNASTDQTAAIAGAFIERNRLSGFSFWSEPVVGLSHARNLGVSKASATYIGFIDDDARAPADWLSHAVRIIRDEQPDIFGGPAWPIFPGGKPGWFRDEYGIRGDMGETGILREGGFLVGTNIFFRRSLILEYGGFDPALGMSGNSISYHEETSLLNRARAEGKKIWYARELAVKDLIPEYKLSLAFLVYSKYKAGKDIWKFQPDDEIRMEPYELLRYIDETFAMFNTALMDRDARLYPFPENYIYENLPHRFYHIGKMIEFFLRKNNHS